jgi:hypothetical protein
MRKLPLSEQKIEAKESISLYIQQKDAFHKAQASMQHEGELHVCIKEMHTHTRKIEIKEEEEL